MKPDLELDHVRAQINQMVQAKEKSIGDNQMEQQHLMSEVHTGLDNDVKRYRINKNSTLTADWCFVDCKLNPSVSKHNEINLIIFLF